MLLTTFMRKSFFEMGLTGIVNSNGECSATVQVTAQKTLMWVFRTSPKLHTLLTFRSADVSLR